MFAPSTTQRTAINSDRQHCLPACLPPRIAARQNGTRAIKCLLNTASHKKAHSGPQAVSIPWFLHIAESRCVPTHSDPAGFVCWQVVLLLCCHLLLVLGRTSFFLSRTFASLAELRYFVLLLLALCYQSSFESPLLFNRVSSAIADGSFPCIPSYSSTKFENRGLTVDAFFDLLHFLPSR